MRKLLAGIVASLIAASALPASAQQTIPKDYPYQFRAPAKFTKSTVFTQGNGNQYVLARGTLFELNAATSSVTTGATTVGVTLPIYTLNATGRGVNLRVWGTTAANANTKTVQILFGTQTISIMSAVASNNNDFYVDVQITRTGTNAQQISVAGWANGALLNKLSVAGTQIEANTLVLQVNVPASTAAADVVLNAVVIEGESGSGAIDG